MILDYAKDEKIDPDALDVEWLEQSSLTGNYCRHAADLEDALRDAKTELGCAKAEIDNAIRQSPEDFEISKITEAVVSNTILLQPKFQEAQKKVNVVLYELDYAKAAIKSIGDKKTALENLVRLHGQQYFAGPSVPRDLDKEWEKRTKQKQSNTKVAKGMKRGK